MEQTPTFALVFVLASGIARASVEVTVANSEFPATLAPAVSNTDLLQAFLDTVAPVVADPFDNRGTRGDNSYLESIEPSGEASLRDGVWLNNAASSRGSDIMVKSGELARYDFDLANSSSDYTINGVDIYTNWGLAAGRDEPLFFYNPLT